MVTHRLFRALGDRIRAGIVEILGRGSLSVSEVASFFDVSRPAVSRHLRVLREAGLVSEARSGRERIYRLEPEALERAVTWLRDVSTGRLTREPLGGDGEAESEAGQKGGSEDWRQW